MTRFLIVLALSASGCTLYFDDGDDAVGDDARPDPDRPDPDRPDPDRPDPDDPSDPATALTVIGTAPSIQQSNPEWATVWLNYPALDCQPVNLYGLTAAVRVDDAYQRFVTASGLVPGESSYVPGWLSLRRRSPDHLWHVVGWAPEAGGEQPACYRW